MAKAAVEALEDVPAVVAANGFSDLALVVTGDDFTSSSRLDTTSFPPRQFVVLRQSTDSALVFSHRVVYLTSRDPGEYAIASKSG